MIPDIYKIQVMRDILHKPEQPEAVQKFIKKLKLNKSDELLLINKHCFHIGDKIQCADLKISIRQFYKLYNNVLIRAYDAMRRCIRYKF